MNRLGLALLLAIFVTLGAVYAIVTPLFEISDELWHYPMVKRLADGHGLPVQDPAHPGPWRQEGSQPPLYYAVMALATAWIDTSDIDRVRWINPHADNGIITPDGNNNIVVHTYREAWPWRGTVSAVRLIRLFSVLLGAGTVYYTYLLAREAVPGQPWLALAAGAFAAFTPMFLFVSASVNNDNLAIMLSAAALWLMAHWLRGRGLPSYRDCALMGVVLGAAGLSKVSTLGLFPLATGVFAFVFLRELSWTSDKGFVRQTTELTRAVRRRSRELGLRLFVVFGLALLVCGWWYWRNFQLYGDWLGWVSFLDTVGRRPHPANLAQLWGERVGFVQAYWGLFGGVSVPMPGWTYTALNVFAGLGMVGLGWWVLQALYIRSRAERRIPQSTVVVPAQVAVPAGPLAAGPPAGGVKESWRPMSGDGSLVPARRWEAWSERALWALVVGWIMLILAGLIRWTSLTWASQGRLIFPAISGISLLTVYGLSRLWRGLPWLAIGFMVALSAAVPFAVIAPHYAAPPELTPEQEGAIGQPVYASFGGEMELLGFDLERDSVRPGEGLALTLYWQSLIAMDRNWSVFVHLIDSDQIIVAQRDRYPGMGALPTTLLRPGQTFADRYVIRIPEATYAPARAKLVVGFYDLLDGERLRLTPDPEHGIPGGGDRLELHQLNILARPGPAPNPIGQNFGHRIELAGYEMDRRSLLPGEALQLTLYWRALAPVSKNYTVFAHVRGDGETLWAGHDAWPQRGAAPTSTWQPGQIVKDSVTLTLDPTTSPGTYDVEVGLYDAATLERLRAITDDGRLTDADFVYLSKIRVIFRP